MRSSLLALALAACSPQLDGTGGGRDGSPGSTTDAARLAVDGGSDDASCGGMSFAVERVPPNVMLVLDRSGSMSQPIANNSTTSKWQDLNLALASIFQSYDGEIHFGAQLFSNPKSPGCNPGPIEVPVGQQNGAAITAQLKATSPSGQTPTAAALDVVIANGMLSDPMRDNFVVLATDGLPNCTDVNVAARISALYARKPSVKTYVIGVGAETNGNPQLLDSWAVAGHTDRQGPTKYYQANSPADLKAAFDAIAGNVASCTFVVAQHPPDPNQLYVWESGKMVPRDATNGYTWDDTVPSLTLHGAACDQLRNDPATKVQVVYGCASPPIQ